MKYFTLSELIRSKDADAVGYTLNTPNKQHECNLYHLVDVLLDPLREKIGEPIYVNSGYRNKVVNRLVGGAANSAHMRGEAVDITLGNWMRNKKLFDAIVELGKFDKVIWERGGDLAPLWVHVEVHQATPNQIFLKKKLRFDKGHYYEI